MAIKKRTHALQYAFCTRREPFLLREGANSAPDFLSFMDDGDEVVYEAFSTQGWEIGIGTLNLSGNSYLPGPWLSRDKIIDSSRDDRGQVLFDPATSITLRTAEEKESVISVTTAYGAVGDGNTADHEAISTGFDETVPLGKTLFFPAGRYLCEAGFDLSNVSVLSIRGEGSKSTTLVFTTANGGIRPQMRANGKIQAEGITLEAAYPITGTGLLDATWVSRDDSSEVVLDDVVFTTSNGAVSSGLVNFSNASWVRVRRPSFLGEASRNTPHGLRVVDPLVVEVDSPRVDGLTRGILVNSASRAFTGLRVNGIMATNVNYGLTASNGTGAQVRDGVVALTGSQAQTCLEFTYCPGVRVSGTSMVIGSSSNQHGVRATNCDAGQVTGLYLTCSSRATTQSAIRVTNSKRFQFRDSDVANVQYAGYYSGNCVGSVLSYVVAYGASDFKAGNTTQVTAFECANDEFTWTNPR